MKKKLARILVVIIISTMYLIGCNDNALNGVYFKVQEYESSDGTYEYWVDEEAFDFKKDGTVQCYENSSSSYAGAYELKDGKVTIFIDDYTGTTLSGEKISKYQLNDRSKLIYLDGKEMEIKEFYDAMCVNGKYYIKL